MFLLSMKSKIVNKKDLALPSRGSQSSWERQRDKKAMTMQCDKDYDREIQGTTEAHGRSLEKCWQ